MQAVGDILKFGPKPPKNKAINPHDVEEDIQAMSCGGCDGYAFLLAADGRIFCGACRNPAFARWDENDGEDGDSPDNPAA